MVTNFGGTDGHVTEPVKDYYEARARGGAGLIITEATCVDFPRGRGPKNQMVIDDDRFLPGQADLARVIKKHGAAAVVQLHHAGHAAKSSVTGQQPVGPSAVPRFAGDEIPRPLAMAEIKELVQRFAQAALRAKRAGFDGVEVHAAHHYLIAQFLSGAWNKREDEYGGDIRSRARFLLEVTRAVRAAVGKDFMVLVRLNGEEYGIEGGTTLEETLAVARMVQEEGIDGLHISAYGQGSQAFKAPEPEIRGGLVPLAEAVKKITRVPVIAVGGLTAPLGEKALAEGRADLVAMGRALIADAELPNKAAQGRAEDIVPCIACLECLNWVVFQRKGLRCSVNPALGHEGELLQPAAKPKRVVVIGGGPAGMEAARVAALRGHQVTLYEKGKELGGQLLSATVPPAKEDIGDLARYLAVKLKKAKVKVVLGTEPGLRQVQSLRPEAVVIATGVSPTVPAIPGIEKARVVMAE
ncbi:MAG: FAD-dependent oxidoreductase, partial [Chloroflexota bacterium]